MLINQVAQFAQLLGRKLAPFDQVGRQQIGRALKNVIDQLADHWAPRPEPSRFTKPFSRITRSIVAIVVVATSRCWRRVSHRVLSAVGPFAHSTRKISSSPSVG